MRRQRGALEVGERACDGVGAGRRRRRWRAPGRARRGPCLRRAARPRRCRATTAALRAWPPRGRRASARRPTTITLPRVQAPVRDPGPVQLGDLVPESRGAARRRLRPPLRAAATSGCSVTRIASPSGPSAAASNVGHADAGAAGHERRERLVLDLLQPADGDAVRRVPVGEQAPAPRQALGVLRVPAEDTHPDRPAARVSDVLRGAEVLPLDGAQIASPRRRARRAPRGSCSAGGTPAAEPKTRRTIAAAPRPSDRPASAAAGSAASRATAPSAADRTSQIATEAHRPHELRAHDDEYRRYGGEAQLRKSPQRQQVVVHRKPVGVDGAAEQASQGGDDAEREHDVPQERPAPPEEHVHGDREGENECAHEDETPERAGPAENRDQGLRNLLVDLGHGVRDDGRECRRRSRSARGRPRRRPGGSS